MSWEELGHHSLVCSPPQKALPQYQHRSPLLSFQVTKCDVVLGRPSLTTYPTCNLHLPFPILLFSLAFVTIGHILSFTNVFIPRLCPPKNVSSIKAESSGSFRSLLFPGAKNERKNAGDLPSFLLQYFLKDHESLVFQTGFIYILKLRFILYSIIIFLEQSIVDSANNDNNSNVLYFIIALFTCQSTIACLGSTL